MKEDIFFSTLLNVSPKGDNSLPSIKGKKVILVGEQKIGNYEEYPRDMIKVKWISKKNGPGRKYLKLPF